MALVAILVGESDGERLLEALVGHESILLPWLSLLAFLRTGASPAITDAGSVQTRTVDLASDTH